MPGDNVYNIKKTVLLSLHSTLFYQHKKVKKNKPEQQNPKNNHTIAQDFLRERIP